MQPGGTDRAGLVAARRGGEGDAEAPELAREREPVRREVARHDGQTLRRDARVDLLAQRRGDRRRLGFEVRRAPHLEWDPERPIVVGYLSGDLHRHAVASFLIPLLEGHDPGRIRPICYSTMSYADDVTERIGAILSKAWGASPSAVLRDVSSLGDPELAREIARDGVDVLIDLSGHTASNRLSVFLGRPAPLAVSGAGDGAGRSCAPTAHTAATTDEARRTRVIDGGRRMNLPCTRGGEIGAIANRDSGLGARGSGLGTRD